MLAYGVGVGYIVLQLPESARRLLHRCRVLRSFPSTQINCGHKAATAVGTEVVTHFGVPNQVLDRRYFEEKVAVKLAPVQQYLVEHGHSDGVGVGKTLFRHRRVAAVDVVYLYVGRCGERVVDDARIAIGQFQVVVGVREVYAHAQFQPRFKLRIEVGAHAQSVEFAADKRSFLRHVVARHVILHLFRPALG